MPRVSIYNPGTLLPHCLHLKLNSSDKLFHRKMYHSMERFEVMERQRSNPLRLKICQAQGKGQGTNQLDDALSNDLQAPITPVVNDQDEEYSKSAVVLSQAETGRVAVLSATKFSSMEIVERGKSLGK